VSGTPVWGNVLKHVDFNSSDAITVYNEYVVKQFIFLFLFLQDNQNSFCFGVSPVQEIDLNTFDGVIYPLSSSKCSPSRGIWLGITKNIVPYSSSCAGEHLN